MFEETKKVLASFDLPINQIPRETVKIFCKNAAFLKLINCRSLQEEYEENQHTKLKIEEGLRNSDTNIIWYILLRGCDRFFREMNRFPG